MVCRAPFRQPGPPSLPPLHSLIHRFYISPSIPLPSLIPPVHYLFSSFNLLLPITALSFHSSPSVSPPSPLSLSLAGQCLFTPPFRSPFLLSFTHCCSSSCSFPTPSLPVSLTRSLTYFLSISFSLSLSLSFSLSPPRAIDHRYDTALWQRQHPTLGTWFSCSHACLQTTLLQGRLDLAPPSGLP